MSSPSRRCSATQAYVLGTDGKLWLETGPWGTVPPSREQVDGNVAAVQALSAPPRPTCWEPTGTCGWRPARGGRCRRPACRSTATSPPSRRSAPPRPAFSGTDGKLWLETGPWGTVPPSREQVDGNVVAVQALSATQAYVLGTDGDLWLETGPWGTVPPSREHVDGNVAAVQALSATQAYVPGTDGNLWLETGPWGAVPPSREHVDGNVYLRRTSSSTPPPPATEKSWGPFGTGPLFGLRDRGKRRQDRCQYQVSVSIQQNGDLHVLGILRKPRQLDLPQFRHGAAARLHRRVGGPRRGGQRLHLRVYGGSPVRASAGGRGPGGASARNNPAIAQTGTQSPPRTTSNTSGTTDTTNPSGVSSAMWRAPS